MRVKGLQVPWMNTELRKAMRDRDYYHRRAVKTKGAEDWNEYKKLNSFVKCEMKRRKAEYYKELIYQNKAKPDKLWKCINEVTGRNNKSTPTCIVSDGVCYTDAQSISEKLNTYFCTIGNILVVKLKSVYSTISTITVPSDDICNTEQFNFVPIPAEYVEKQLSCLQKNKAIGSDRISARLLKDASSVIATSLAKLFNRSLTLASFPSSWKIGRITALYKQGDRTDVNNYRPITILPVISKLLERAVYDQLYEYLLTNKILAKEQFGFRAKRSTDAALIHITDKILASMDAGKVTGAAFLDVSKAFDTVNHELLLQKLLTSGMSDNSDLVSILPSKSIKCHSDRK